MKTILLVDDDALVLELYRKKLVAAGFAVRTAADGLQAVKELTAKRPDFVVLDLMMPRLSGADVLKFIRSTPALAKVPVAILTNAFMNDHARTVMAMGVEHAIVKGECTPARMLEFIQKTLVAPPRAEDCASAKESAQSRDEARAGFFAEAPATFTDLRGISQEFADDPAMALRSGNLADFYRQVHHLAAAASLAQCHHVALLAGALEALLFELSEKPQCINASTARTVSTAVEFLAVLLEAARTHGGAEPFTGEVLVVDDDALANRMALAALQRARLAARAEEDPFVALDLMTGNRFDLVLLDVEMPGMTGFDVCRKLRALPGYEKTPVVFVTAHSEFENRAKGILLGGNDLIAKPILPIELAVKAVCHLIRGRLADASSSLPA
jgi:CheY-like chemotaxis protein